MSLRGVLARAGVFVVVLGLIAGGGLFVTGSPVSPSPPTVSEDATAPFTGPDKVVAPSPENGSLNVEADGDGKVVVVDTAHSGELSRAALTPFTNALVDSGAEVRYALDDRTRDEPLNTTLAGADAYVVVGQGAAYTNDQLRGIANFTASGGRVLIVDEPNAGVGGIASLLFGGGRRDTTTRSLAPLASQAGMGFGDGYLYSVENYDTNYRNVYATPTADGPLTEGVSRTVFHTALPVTGPGVVATSPDTTVSDTRRQERFTVVARSGNTTVVGDSSVFDPEYLYRADNEVLVSNVLEFLLTGEKRPADAPGRDSGESRFGA
ncbi:DUF4350 domain-containing protein [Halobaculum sp. MBLA0143]|uniref:DUF4350 domain-containing protein n=1 Tax=Halobaculum sp. MBLA0143 TaxID=3079933 RepID=UPI003524CA49